MTILVTGAAGFIGFHTAKRLLARGDTVVGFDNIFAADVCTPTLTTLGGAHADLGRVAVELLLTADARAADDQPSILLPTELVLRGSTGPVG